MQQPEGVIIYSNQNIHTPLSGEVNKNIEILMMNEAIEQMIGFRLDSNSKFCNEDLLLPIFELKNDELSELAVDQLNTRVNKFSL